MYITWNHKDKRISISFDREAGYDVRRCAVLLNEQIEHAEDTSPLTGYDIVLEVYGERYATDATPEVNITVENNRICACAGGILAFEKILGYFEELLKEKKHPYSVTMRSDEGVSSANRFAFRRLGTHRVMFYNILWDNDIYRAPHERNIMTASIVREFSPDVVGFQECGGRKRDACGSFDIAIMMKNAGYVEAIMPKVENCYHNVNCTPLFYREKTTRFIEGGYHWYSVQAPDIYPNDASSKSFSWGIFESKENGERYIAVSTHMCTQKDEIRGIQAKEACEIFAELKEKYGLPIILGGDMNGNRRSANYRYFTETAGYEDPFKMASEYISPEKPHHPYPKTNFELGLSMPTEGSDFDVESAIDHIFFPNRPQNMRVASFCVVVNSYSLASSDHFPIFTDFTLDN